jgi:hypothetical protein
MAGQALAGVDAEDGDAGLLLPFTENTPLLYTFLGGIQPQSFAIDIHMSHDEMYT